MPEQQQQHTLQSNVKIPAFEDKEGVIYMRNVSPGATVPWIKCWYLLQHPNYISIWEDKNAWNAYNHGGTFGPVYEIFLKGDEILLPVKKKAYSEDDPSQSIIYEFFTIKKKDP